MAFDVGGRIVLEDAFSATFNDALAKAKDTERAFEDVGAAADGIGAPDMSGMRDQLDDLKARGEDLQSSLAGWRVEVDTDAAEQGLESVQERIAGLKDMLTKARAMAAGGAIITPEGLQAYKQAESELAGLEAGLARMTGEGEKAGVSLKSVAVGIAALTAAGFAAQGIAATAYELTGLGAAAIDVKNAFEGLAQSRGVDASQLLSGLEGAARGAIASSELMASANKIMLDSGSELADRLPALFDAARASAMLTGKDTTAAFQSIVQAVDGANEAALRAQGFAVNLSSANRAWADANNRTVESLSDLERVQIAANAVLAVAPGLIQEMGAESQTASEKMRSLPVAIDDVKTSLGELLVEVGAAEKVSEFATVLSTIADNIGAATTLKAIRDELSMIGKDDAAKRLASDMQALVFERGKVSAMNAIGLISDAEAAQRYAEIATGVEGLISIYEALIPAQQGAATSAATALDVWSLTHPTIVAAAAATSTYQAALDALNVSLSGTAALEKQFAQAVATGSASLQVMPEMPDVSAAMDTGALRAWGDAWLAINPNLAEARASLEGAAVSIQAHQQAVLADALAIGDMDARLKFLTTSLFGSGASINDLIGALSGMPPELLAAIGPADDLAVSLARLKAQADQGINIIVTMQGVGQVANDIESMAVRLSKLYGADNARKWYDAALAQNEQYWQAIGPQDKLGMEMAAAAISGTLDSAVSEAEQSFNRIETAAQESFDGIAQSAGELQGKIESALSTGLAVTAKDMADTLAGTYEDAPLEAARQLDAIAARGFAELTAHPDWAGILKIPPEVLSGSEDALKAWAAGTSSDVKNLLRPDLIDWKAFVGDFQQSLDDEAAKKLTIDIAVEKLSAAGLLSGSAEERRKKVAQMLGIEAPEMTIDALFKTSPTARTDMINEVTGGTGVVTFDAQMKFLNRAADALAPPDAPLTPTDPGYDRWIAATQEGIGAAPLDVAKMVDVEASSEVLLASGARVAQLLSQGVTDSIDMSQAVTLTAQSITLGADAFAKELNTAGGAVWGKVQAGINEAVDNGAPDIVNRLAESIAPSVAKILARDSRRTGGP